MGPADFVRTRKAPKPIRGQSTQQEPGCCIRGHRLVTYEQYTQKSPGFGLSRIFQCSRAQKRRTRRRPWSRSSYVRTLDT
jgi:hypothetical protein